MAHNSGIMGDIVRLLMSLFKCQEQEAKYQTVMYLYVSKYFVLIFTLTKFTSWHYVLIGGYKILLHKALCDRRV